MFNRLPRTARAGLLAVLMGGTALGGAASWAYADTPPAPVNAQGTLQPTQAANLLPDFSNLAAQVSPAVVSVTVRERPERAEQGGRGARQGSGMPFGMGQKGGQDSDRDGSQMSQQVRQARASGFIIDPDGTIVTNNHVVKDADRVSVTLSDGTELPARVVGRDPRTDLAVIKVSAGHRLPALELGDSDQVRPGQWVLAVGNPFGLGGTVTAGIVSARGRDIGSGPYDQFLQVDAAINQGNSGGPLFTQDGRVVGVNTAILSPSGGSIGIGFAIPSSLVKNVVGQLRTAGHVTRGFLGVETQPVTASIAPGLGLPADAKGALVAAVSPDSPASRAGLQPGDVLQTVNGTTVRTPHELATMVAEAKPGDTAQIGLVRDGKPTSLDVKLTALLDDRQTADAAGEQAPAQGRIGIALAPLSPELRDQLELGAQQKGVVVAGVQPGSPAAAAGLRQGDLLVGVGAKAVTEPGEAVTAIRAATKDGKDVALRIMRDGQARFVAVSPNAEG